MRRLLLLLASFSGAVHSLRVTHARRMMARSSTRTSSPHASLKEEEELLGAVRSSAAVPRSATLRLFSLLEEAAPSPSDLLQSTEGVAMLDGRWSLRSTIAAKVGESDDELSDTGVTMAVNASGLVLDVGDRTRSPIQEINVGSGRIGNEIRFSVAGAADVIVRVAGTFEAASDNGRRALVNFDTLDVFLIRNGGDPLRLLRLGWLFTAVRAMKPALINGDESSASWLDTTYISSRVRLGRGNKGSVFVLERADGGDGPLSSFDL